MSSTEPPAPAITPAQRRSTGESFGIDPARYDRTRPPYPQAMIDRIVESSPGSNYLNAGCGTGIEARQFRAGAGCRTRRPDGRLRTA
ncbi:hypothetical protein B7C42_02701 [Nocardia cerradoensis]|uniref:Uncharacterized protein n=1 Tax=Nocardia cerradoensis TaxID=85688 RepID=A0A231H7L4_9NOCA|nr:hypothetical protein [Nocardia cerradoensis]OXR44747.1 hypothetical protein B7C42_02701 [Nocardia cerradoensis]